MIGVYLCQMPGVKPSETPLKIFVNGQEIYSVQHGGYSFLVGYGCVPMGCLCTLRPLRIQHDTVAQRMQAS